MVVGSVDWVAPLMDARVLAVHLGMGVMLGTGYILRRSLGAWPCWLATFAYAALLEALWSCQGLPREAGLAALIEMLVLPTALLLLARYQAIPGLRRGEWSAEQRQRWMLRRGLSQLPQTPLRQVVRIG